MKWFGRKAGGRAARPVLARGFGVAFGSGAWPRSYEARVREAYELNPIAQRAVRLVAESVGAAPVACSEPEVARLVAAASGGQGLVETLASHLLLHGNSYVQILMRPSTSLGTSEVVAELFALRPDRVTVEADARGWPGAYLYQVGEVAQRIEAREIIHGRAFHPSDDHYGLGCLGAAAGAVAIHNAATQWNKALLDNAARPSGALVYEPGDGAALSAEQFERLRGRRGTGWAAGAHATGERFALIEEEALTVYDPPLSAVGATVRLMASGIGDAAPVEVSAAAIGAALRPPAPVHLTARRRDDGRFDLAWVRSSRAGWTWLDGVDAPVAEAREAYRLTIEPDSGPGRVHDLTEAGFLYDPADDAGAASVSFTVVQAGNWSLSRPAALTLSL
ncbi:MAG: phage portal protein [Proteobacteria bacterium]|nr:phage portal protein [Pseudomonadota bacterium]